MRVDDWMTRTVQVVRPRDSILHARELMEQHRINQLPVVVDKRVVGIVTDRDLRDAFPSALESAWQEARRKTPPLPPAVDPRTVSVETVMTPHVLTLAPSDSIAAAAQMMQRERIGAVPVVEHGRLVGILTRCDLLKAFVSLLEGVDEQGHARGNRSTHGGVDG